MKKIYLAGPMSGIPKQNFPEFDRVAAELRGMGHRVWSPADMDRDMGYDAMIDDTPPEPELLKKMFLEDLKVVIMDVDEIALLDGWRNSKGACIEVAVASLLGKPCYEYPTEKKVELHANTAASETMQEVAMERRRQIGELGHTLDNDLAYNGFGMCALGAIAYAMTAVGYPHETAEEKWPWTGAGFKPKSTERDLIRAAALLIAEMDRGRA